jgi:hypothetical protein
MNIRFRKNLFEKNIIQSHPIFGHRKRMRRTLGLPWADLAGTLPKIQSVTF